MMAFVFKHNKPVYHVAAKGGTLCKIQNNVSMFGFATTEDAPAHKRLCQLCSNISGQPYKAPRNAPQCETSW